MTDLYSEWREFYAEKVRSWMSLEELRAECGKLQTADNQSPEVLLVHAMHALEEREALLRQVLEPLDHACQTAMEQTLKARIPECGEFAGIAQDLDFVVVALRERLGEDAQLNHLETM